MNSSQVKPPTYPGHASSRSDAPSAQSLPHQRTGNMPPPANMASLSVPPLTTAPLSSTLLEKVPNPGSAMTSLSYEFPHFPSLTPPTTPSPHHQPTIFSPSTLVTKSSITPAPPSHPHPAHWGHQCFPPPSNTPYNQSSLQLTHQRQKHPSR